MPLLTGLFSLKTRTVTVTEDYGPPSLPSLQTYVGHWKASVVKLFKWFLLTTQKLTTDLWADKKSMSLEGLGLQNLNSLSVTRVPYTLSFYLIHYLFIFLGSVYVSICQIECALVQSSSLCSWFIKRESLCVCCGGARWNAVPCGIPGEEDVPSNFFLFCWK